VFSDHDRARILELVDRALRSGSLTLGETGQLLEEAFAARHRAPNAVTVASGTAALEIILRAVGVERSEVVVPANTFFATAAAVVHAGGTPRFADVDPATFALSASSIAAALTRSVAAVVLVHIGGMITSEMDEIRALCERRSVTLIEDAAHAHGSSFDGHPAGSWGRAAAWSFYPTKVVTSGEGGMITTADDALAAEARVYRDQGKASFLGGGHVRLGYAWRMSELHAAVGLVHLGHLDEFVATRRRIAAHYDAALTGVAGAEPLPVAAGCVSNYYKYPVRLGPGVDRARLKERMARDHGVALSGEVYATPLHREPVFAHLATAALPGADDVCGRHVCLPVHSDMTAAEAEHVVGSLAAVLGEDGG
jgi:dTDP-4-amino-4,6-dideoxygalactose transaminase